MSAVPWMSNMDRWPSEASSSSASIDPRSTPVRIRTAKKTPQVPG